MLELLFTTLAIFIFFMIIFSFLPVFKMIQYVLFTIQLIVLILLFFPYYDCHILLKGGEPTMINHLSFKPLTNIELNDNSDNTFSKFSYSHISGDYSLEKTEYYYNECLENYFISSRICPITDIIIEDKKTNHENYNEIKINDNKYIYFTNFKKDGTLYTGEYDDVSLVFKSSFDYDYAKKLKKIKEDIKSNPLLELDNFSHFSQHVCLILMTFYFFQSWMEKCQNCKCNYFKILNIMIQIGMLIIQSIRYDKFMKVKQFFFDNEYYYKDNKENYLQGIYYYPNKFFNIDSFPIGIIINILLINLLYIIIPNKCQLRICNKDESEFTC